tara:strand:+ start:9479 stop:10642 length:1164 start_codon:yes stop_codon:yes gene_type:complete
MSHVFMVLAPNKWNSLWMNRQQLMSRIGKKYPVIYSNGPYFSWERKEAMSESTLRGSFHKQDNVILDTSPLMMMRFPIIPKLDEFIVKGNAKRWSVMMSHVAPKAKRVLYVFHPDYWDYVKHIPHDVLVYHCYDNFITMESGGEQMKEKEANLARQADFIFTSSEVNRDRIASDYDCEHATFLPNGVDFELFTETPASAAEKFLSQQPLREKRVGYIGSLNDKVDLKVVDHLSEKIVDADFVFVGRVNNLSESNQKLWDIISQRDNVKVYPPCDRTMVPGILKSMSVNCIYYDLSGDNFSSAGYPLKLHEYLASGKPAVSSAIRSVQAFSDVVGVAETHEKWEKMIRRALENPEEAPSDSDERITTASENSWDHRVDSLMRHMGIEM